MTRQGRQEGPRVVDESIRREEGEDVAGAGVGDLRDEPGDPRHRRRPPLPGRVDVRRDDDDAVLARERGREEEDRGPVGVEAEEVAVELGRAERRRHADGREGGVERLAQEARRVLAEEREARAAGPAGGDEVERLGETARRRGAARHVVESREEEVEAEDGVVRDAVAAVPQVGEVADEERLHREPDVVEALEVERHELGRTGSTGRRRGPGPRTLRGRGRGPRPRLPAPRRRSSGSSCR